MPEILEGIKILQDLEFKNIKINAVLLNGINSSEKDFDQWSKYIKNNMVDFRYIELMQTGDNLEYFNKYHVPSTVFKNYFQEEVHKAADKVKTPKAKASKLSKLYDGLDLIDSNEDGLKRAVELYTVLQGAKEVFIRKLEKGERFGTYLKTEDGFQITAPEGYVAIDEGNNAIKLVDRLEFSKANFNVSKNWVSGDEK